MNAPLLPALPGYADPQLIAHGTTALVFRAIQTRLNRPVAIKVITTESGDGSVPVNVERELATTVALSSQPHIVSIIDTGVTDDGRRYIVMEYCEGGSYAQILRQNGPLSVDDVVEVGIKIGQALHAAHEAGIVHRDVKPSNILRSRFGPALTDFGIARAPDELGGTLTREMMTPHHASPEALLHQAQSGLSDVYSLASTMWTLLVGHPPFVDPDQPGMDMYAFRDRVLHDPLPAMPRDDVPAWLVAELHTAMAKLPAHRHASALDFSEAIQRGALGMPAPGRRTPADSPVVTRSTPGSVLPQGIPAQAWPRPLTTDEPDPVAAEASASMLATVSASPSAESPWAAPPRGVPTPTSPAPAGVHGPTATQPVAQVFRPQPAAADPQPPTSAPPAQPGPGRVDPTRPLGVRPRPRPTRRTRQRRQAALIAILIVTALAGVGAGYLLYTSTRPQPTTPPTNLPSVVEAGPVVSLDLTIEADNGDSVTLAWTDPTGGQQSYVAVQSDPLITQVVPSGGAERSATFTGLAADRDYCFRVVVIISTTEQSHTPEVCTTR